MGDVRICRICLNTDVEMQDLLSYPLETYFASMMIDSKVGIFFLITHKQFLTDVYYDIDDD